MTVNLLCFTKDNNVIALSNEDQLYSTISNLLENHTFMIIDEFETTQQMVDHLKEHGVNLTKLKLDLSDLIEEE